MRACNRLAACWHPVLPALEKWRPPTLPPPGRMDANARGPGGEGKTCIDVCSELGGFQDCAARCVVDPADRSHACREACQVAFGAACDRAFPSDQDPGGENYRACLGQLAKSCTDTCREYGG